MVIRDMKKYMREYRQRHAEELKAKRREYYQRPDVKAKQREYYQRPDVKAKQREYQREYYQRPDVKARDKRRLCKVGNVENIKRICLEHGFSEDVAEAIALDGEVLDKKMKEKGVI